MLTLFTEDKVISGFGDLADVDHTIVRPFASLELPPVDFSSIPEQVRGFDVLGGLKILGMTETFCLNYGGRHEYKTSSASLLVYRAEDWARQTHVDHTVGTAMKLRIGQFLATVKWLILMEAGRPQKGAYIVARVPGYAELPFLAVAEICKDGVWLHAEDPYSDALSWKEGTYFITA